MWLVDTWVFITPLATVQCFAVLELSKPSTRLNPIKSGLWSLKSSYHSGCMATLKGPRKYIREHYDFLRCFYLLPVSLPPKEANGFIRLILCSIDKVSCDPWVHISTMQTRKWIKRAAVSGQPRTHQDFIIVRLSNYSVRFFLGGANSSK